MVSMPRRAHSLMREVDFSSSEVAAVSCCHPGWHWPRSTRNWTQPFPSGMAPSLCVAVWPGSQNLGPLGEGKCRRGQTGRRPPGNSSSSRQKMKSGVCQAGNDEQWVLPEQWGQHQGLWNALIRCARQGSAPPPTIYSRPSGRKS